jgi:hypothetical protein
MSSMANAGVKAVSRTGKEQVHRFERSLRSKELLLTLLLLSPHYFENPISALTPTKKKTDRISQETKH